MSPSAWRSHKLKRKTAGATHLEVLGIPEGLAIGEYLRCVWLAATQSDFVASQPYTPNAHCQCPLLGVTDSKGGFDHLTLPTSGPRQDLRCAVDVAVVRESLRLPATSLRWVDGAKQQITDALTKRLGNADLLRAILRTGVFAIVDHQAALDLKKEERDRRKLRAHVQPPHGLAASLETPASVPFVDPDSSSTSQELLNLESEYRRDLREKLALSGGISGKTSGSPPKT